MRFFRKGGTTAKKPNTTLLYQLLEYNPDVFVVCIGGNDIYSNSVPVVIAEDIRSLISTISHNGCDVYYVDICERGAFIKDHKLTKKSFCAQRHRINKLVSKSVKVITMNNVRFPKDYTTDFVHFSYKGQLKILFQSQETIPVVFMNQTWNFISVT